MNGLHASRGRKRVESCCCWAEKDHPCLTGVVRSYARIDIRHGCEEGDKFEKYGWLKHDGRSFGVQQLKDTRNNVELTTDFIKIPGGEHGKCGPGPGFISLYEISS